MKKRGGIRVVPWIRGGVFTLLFSPQKRLCLLCFLGACVLFKVLMKGDEGLE